MAKVNVNYDEDLGAKVEAAFGGAIQEHLQSAVDRFMERMEGEVVSTIRKTKMDKYDRLKKAKQSQIDVLLSQAPEIEEKKEIKE